MVQLTKLFWKFVIWRLRKTWGEPCKTVDYDDFGEVMWFRMPDSVKHKRLHLRGMSNVDRKDINVEHRCPTCSAHQVIKWIQRMMIDL
jgi:hypothetical protein